MMEQIEGVTKEGICLKLAEWDAAEADYDASGWLEQYGHLVGNGVVQFPMAQWVDLSQFAIVRERIQ